MTVPLRRRRLPPSTLASRRRTRAASRPGQGPTGGTRRPARAGRGEPREPAGLVAARRGLYVRWSPGPGTDMGAMSRRDDVTGPALPGLPANPLDVEEWWEGRPVRVRVARRLYDYSRLPGLRDSRTRPWVLAAREAARGPDNEPLVTDVRPLGWIGVSGSTPSQAEGDREQDGTQDTAEEVARTTPSQAEGDRSDEDDDPSDDPRRRADWESGWSGP
ncbi:DUF6098 family protein [Streptomyces sp. NPDC057412]|uniref:DUF6098 family protein n=1 Tax=Streptomyces sp. NPDC057412 TaxID=3346123 RepID=UPI0036CCAB08